MTPAQPLPAAVRDPSGGEGVRLTDEQHSAAVQAAVAVLNAALIAASADGMDTRGGSTWAGRLQTVRAKVERSRDWSAEP